MSKNVETKKTGMMKSHTERLCEPSVDYPKTLCQDYEVRGTEDVVENGRIVKKSTIVTVHPQDKFKGMNADDFALENVIAAGALDSLKEGKLGANTLSELSDSMEGTIDNVISAVDAAESQNVESKSEGE